MGDRAIDTSNLIPEAEIRGEDTAETAELKSMLQEAKDYVASFGWAPPVTEAHMGIGIGGVVAVFLLRLAEPVGEEGDRHLWVIVGDLPPAYLVTDGIDGPLGALAVYCDLMSDWAEAVKSGSSLDECFPVRAPPDSDHAEMLLDRVRFMRERIIAQRARRQEPR